MTWSAFKEQHAIERVRVSLHFKDHLPSKIMTKILTALDDRKSELELNSVTDAVLSGIELHIGPSGKAESKSIDVNGRIFSKTVNENLVGEQLTVRPETFSFETVEYVRWAQFLDRFQTILTEAVGVALSVSDIAVVQMEYWDRFVFDGAKESATPTYLLNNLEDQIPKSSTSGEMPWHLHKGWFERRDEITFLVNLNYASQDAEEVNGNPPSRSLSIYNKIELRGPENLNVENLTEQVLDQMHLLSKEVFAKNLTDEAKGMLKL